MAKADVNDIVTDELSTGIGQMQRNDLVNNFKIIKEILGGNDSSKYLTSEDLAKVNQAIDGIKKYVTDSENKMNSRINRIVLGTDQETIKLVVRQILKDEGVI